MRVVEACVSRSARINTGNYEGTEFFVSMKAELDEFDGPEEIIALAASVETALLVQLVASYTSRGKKLTAQQIARQHGLGKVKLK